MQVIPIRIFFEKSGRAKYTSHLDTMRCMTRAFKRSGLPLWYTQGYNPHLYCTFPMPISLGFESQYETVDVRLTEPVSLREVAKRLDEALPEGFHAFSAAQPVMKAEEIAWADYRLLLYYPTEKLPSRKNKWYGFFDQPEIEAVKRTKKGETVIDLAPHCKLLRLRMAGDCLLMSLRLASGSKQNINPRLVLNTFEEWSGHESGMVQIARTGIFNEKMEHFH